MTRPLSPDTLVYGLAAAGNPQVSPDGARIVYTLTTTDPTTMTSTSQLWMCGIDGGDARRLTWSGERNTGARWSPNGEEIAFVSDRVRKSGIFILPASSAGEAREVARHGQQIGDLAWSPDGTFLAYTALVDPENPDDEESPAGAAPRVRVTRRLDYKQDNRGYLGDARLQVFVVDVATGERRQVTHMLNDHTSPQWSPDGRQLAVRMATHNGLCAHPVLVHLDRGETQVLGPAMGTVGVWAWSPSGDRIIFAGDTSLSAHPDFFLHEVTGATTRRLTEDLRPLPDAGFPTILPPAQPVWLDDHRALFHGIQAGKSLLATVDCVTGGVETVQEWNAINSGLSADSAARFVVQAHSSFEAVGEIAVFDRTTERTQIITAHNAAVLAESPPARWEHLIVERGAFAIDAWLLLPPDFSPTKRYPVVLDVHGGPHGHHGHAFNNIQQCLATNDFLVVVSNPRGSGSYGRDFAQEVWQDWGGEDYYDLQAVVDAVVARPYADAERLGIWGYSYGGYMTAWTIGQTDRFKAAVCGAPCFDLESMYGTSDIGHVFCDMQYGGEPHANEQWYRDHSPSTYAHQARTPTLIIHGEADDRCPIGQGEQMFVALKKAGCEVEFVRYPGGSHALLRVGPPAHRADVLARILGWFKAHLGEAA